MREHRLVVADGDWSILGSYEMAKAIDEVLDRQDRCILGLSGGSTPAPVFERLSRADLDWRRVTIVQVDERIAMAGTPERNLTDQQRYFGTLPVEWLPLPVDDPEPGALDRFARDFDRATGGTGRIDVAHLGLGGDGHTASLIPGDPVLDVTDRPVAVTEEYQDTRRMTLTRPVLDAVGVAIWLITGAEKADRVKQLLAGDRSIPAGQLRMERSVLVVDVPAASGFVPSG